MRIDSLVPDDREQTPASIDRGEHIDAGICSFSVAHGSSAKRQDEPLAMCVRAEATEELVHPNPHWRP
jgi:hypothetical protein